MLLPASFAVLLAGALLFTNAIEWFGSRLELGQGAVGSLLAAVATALPESLIPVVAIIEADARADDVAIGAILGAPLLLATIARPSPASRRSSIENGARRRSHATSTSRR